MRPRVATCHDKFDFAGLVFEGYGPIGQRRSQDLGGKPIDDRTQFPDGSADDTAARIQAHREGHSVTEKPLADGSIRSIYARYGIEHRPPE